MSRPSLPSPGPATTAVCCGDAARRQWGPALDAVGDGAAHPVDVVDVGERPGRSEIDPLVARTERLVVAGDDAALAAVLVRLLRRERLDVEVALLPAAVSEAAAVWRVPTDPADAVALARDGAAAPVPLIRDDRGGVVAGSHRLGAFHGAVYCDERRVASGDAAALVVRPDPVGHGVAAVVTDPPRLGGLRPGRVHEARGRAVQVGCRPAVLLRDGVLDDRTLERRSWYRHVEDWHLVRP